ncbi:BREX-1 system phosphatase PglZ type A [Ruminiclostridium herbifermentans]|uniref:BREX-1 system phosphatase PglZ type A n=1 Tax=Ruminiclostridium herbifermentans TaxID=2488810 RepID=A0A7H1VKI6_9FIRM|nr:BREX-1 system phosphatase PglZ type A [Ruminiclostridium herbifermentans]QNU65898.1 BREX-1 system phosphatase PglZ type A [Ruminiclostridium herbifermentans]
MNLTEVQNVLNTMLSAEPSDGQKRNIVFWYDDDGEFQERISEIELKSAKLLTISNNSFYIKYLIEEEEPETNFLVYSPCSKPQPRDNFLIDILKYSKEFSADSTTVIMRDLKIDVSLRSVVKKYAVFFGNKDRYRKFASYGLTKYSEQIIDTAVLSALLKLPALDIEGVFKTVLVDGLLGEGKFITDIEKFGDMEAFWSLAGDIYGYTLKDKDIKLLAISMFLKHMSVTYRGSISENMAKFIGENISNAFVFIENFMNTPNYIMIAEMITDDIKLPSLIKDIETDSFIETDTFPIFDREIIRRLIENLTHKAGEFDKYIRQIKERRKSHFYKNYENEYSALYYAAKLLSLEQHYGKKIKGSTAIDLYELYKKEYYLFDTYYRKFILHYDRIQNLEEFTPLFMLIENTYINFFLSELSVKWESAVLGLQTQWSLPSEIPQQQFCKKIVSSYIDKGEKLFVVISDGLRYEVAKELCDVLNTEHKGIVNLDTMLGVLPSYTSLGMAALLPGEEISYSDSGEVRIDGMPTKSTEQRATVLKKKYPKSTCVSFDDIRTMSKEELRAVTVGQDLIYVYHNTIDGRGDNASTEKQVFEAAEDCITELTKLVRKLKNDGNATNILITADHGFIYRRTALNESDKTPKELISYLIAKRRFIMTADKKEIHGTSRYAMDYLMKDSSLEVVIPKGTNCYKVSGSGSNYVHGGASLQEIMIPVIRFKSDRSSSDKLKVKKVSVSLTSLTRKITSMITYLEFFQNEVVEEKWVPVRLKAYFADEEGNRISNENIIIADSRSKEFADRTFKEKFTLKSGKYDKTKPYYLILADEEEKINEEVQKIKFNIDLIFNNDLGL